MSVSKENDAKNLVENLQLGRISRRNFVKGAMALGVTATLANTMAINVAEAATPKKGGRMTLAMGHGSTTDTLDPAVIENGWQWVAMFGICNTLTELAADGELVPSLAESWEPSADLKTWRFKIRQGIEFHDGRKLTAKDVAGNFRYHTGESSKSIAKAVLKPIIGIEVEDDYTVVIKLDSGNADFAVSLNSANLSIMPSTEEGDVDWKSMVGTGGYRLKSFNPGVSAVFERNENYWKKDRAHADEIELLSIKDSVARTTAIMTGSVDAIDNVDTKTALLLARNKNVVVEESSGPLHYVFAMQMSVPPFDNVHVRQALKLSIDREEFVKKILSGRGVVGNDHPIGKSYRYIANDIDQNSFDPEEAKWHLKQAGMENLSVDLHTSDAAYSGAVDAAALFQNNAKESGININIVREPKDGYWSNVWKVKPFVVSYWGGYPTEDIMLTTGYTTGAAWNETQFSDKEFESLLVAARGESDVDKRRMMYQKIQIILRDRGGVIVPAFANNLTARTKRIAHGDHVSPLKAFDGRRIFERWWVA